MCCCCRFAPVWSYAPLPDGFTLAHYATVFQDSSGMIKNTLLYCSLAAGLDVVLGVTIAYLILRTTLPARQWLDWIATASLAVPGIVLAIGYLRLYKGVLVPGTEVLVTSTWVMIMLAYAVRRLPYALRSCVAALQQVHVSLEEAAESLGATKMRTIRRVVVPLMAGGILAGFVTSFITAAVELSATILLVSAESQAPMSYGIYLYMQSIAGRGPGAALGVLAIVVVGHRHLPVASGGRAHAAAFRDAPDRRHAAATVHRATPEPEDAMKKVSVECRNVRLAYGATEVLKDVNLDIEPGEFFALLGPSGSGKSTLLRLIAGFNPHQHGQLLIDGVDITGQPPWKRNIGMVFQSYALWPHLSVWDNVAFGLVERKVSTGGAEDARRGGARTRRADGLRRAAAQPVVGRPAAARGAGAHHRHRAAGAAAGRAAVQPGQDAARADAPGTAGAAAPPGHHDDLRHPRPGRGDDAPPTAWRCSTRAWCSRWARRPRCTTTR